MSSQDKDPLEKQDTPSESSESHSDSEVNKAEENLVRLNIEQRLAKEEPKEESDESKPLDSPNQEGTLVSEYDLQNEPIAGPSGIGKPRLSSSESSFDQEKDIDSSDPPKDMDKELKVGTKNIDAEKVLADSDTTGSMPIYSSSSAPATPSKTTKPNKHRRQKKSGVDKSDLYWREGLRAYFTNLQQSSSSRLVNYATDSANTSSDFPEMPSEIGDDSEAGSFYQDAPESFEKDQSPSYKSAVERQSSEASDTNISDLPEDFSILPTVSDSSASISTPSGEGGYQDFIAQCQREADERGEPPSSSSGIASTNQSELEHLKCWGLLGEMALQRRNADNRSVSEGRDIPEQEAQVEEQLAASDLMDDQSILQQRSQDFDKLFQRNEGNREEHSEAGIHSPENAACEIQKASNVGVALPLNRRRQAKYSEDSSSVEKGASGHLRLKVLPQLIKRSKKIPSKSNDPFRCSSESPEPKSTSSDESHRKESPEIKSSSESSQAEMDKKLWQKSGHLRSMQLAPISSKSSIITEEEEEQISESRHQNLVLMESKVESPEKMDTTGENAFEEKTQPSKSLTPETSKEVDVLEGEDNVKEQEPSLEVQEIQRKVGKSKRAGAKLSNSPSSEEKSASTFKKASTKTPEKKRRTRIDSNDSLPTGTESDSFKKREPSSSDESNSSEKAEKF